jgi:hypothetical protein
MYGTNRHRIIRAAENRLSHNANDPIVMAGPKLAMTVSQFAESSTTILRQPYLSDFRSPTALTSAGIGRKYGNPGLGDQQPTQQRRMEIGASRRSTWGASLFLRNSNSGSAFYTVQSPGNGPLSR